MSTVTEETEETKVHLTREDYLILVCWVENPVNFAMIHGCEKKAAVGANTTKPDAFKKPAEHLHVMSKTPGQKLLSADSVKRRWSTYKSKFTRTLNAKRSETGLTNKEIKAGLSIAIRYRLPSISTNTSARSSTGVFIHSSSSMPKRESSDSSPSTSNRLSSKRKCFVVLFVKDRGRYAPDKVCNDYQRGGEMRGIAVALK